MPFYQFILLLLLPTLLDSANVLVISGLRGSHLYITTEVAGKLVEFGHNVTVLTAHQDPRVDFSDRNFGFTTYADDRDPGGRDFFTRWERAIDRTLTLPSEDMIVDLLEQVEDVFTEFHKLAISYYTGDKFSELLHEGKFDLIVLEQSEMLGASPKLVHLDIPILGLYCVSEMKGPRDFQSLPGLHNSEIASMNEVNESPPTLADRWKTVWRQVRLYAQMYPVLSNLFKEEMEKTRLSINDYYLSLFDIILVNDHPAFSFPYLTPPNTFYLGPLHLIDRVISPLPDLYSEFISNCPYPHVVYLSFGTYFQGITQLSKSEDIIRTLAKMKFCVIVKTNVDIAEQYHVTKTQFLSQNWIPQKDLLGSGKILFFISHCGNNGRMESIYYNVPLLCIPLFADQYHNARLVRSREFGVCLTREELSTASLEQALDVMVARRAVHVENMREAVQIAVNDPGAGTDVLRFYSDLLIKNKNAEFLINRIVEKQWSYEILNLDFLLLAFLALAGTALLFITCIYKCIRYCCRNRKSKSKCE